MAKGSDEWGIGAGKRVSREGAIKGASEQITRWGASNGRVSSLVINILIMGTIVRPDSLHRLKRL